MSSSCKVPNWAVDLMLLSFSLLGSLSGPLFGSHLFCAKKFFGDTNVPVRFGPVEFKSSEKFKKKV